MTDFEISWKSSAVGTIYIWDVNCFLEKYEKYQFCACWTCPESDDDEFRFNDTSTHEGHLHQNGVLTWFYNKMAIMISHIMEVKEKK